MTWENRDLEIINGWIGIEEKLGKENRKIIMKKKGDEKEEESGECRQRKEKERRLWEKKKKNMLMKKEGKQNLQKIKSGEEMEERG